MKKVLLISLGILLQLTSQAQPAAPAQPSQAKPIPPSQPVPGVVQPNAQRINPSPQRSPTATNLPNATFAQTNNLDAVQTTNLPPNQLPSTNNSAATYGQTNRLDNPPNTNRFGTNGLRYNGNGATTPNNGNNPGAVFAVTNSLSRMAPAQAATVVQFQSGLNNLQQLAVNLNGVQNVQQIIQQNPQVQQQLTQVERQIHALTRGQKRLSDYVVQRLSQDLLVVSSPGAQLTPDRQLVLAVLVNQACNGMNLTPAQVEATANGSLMTLQDAGVPLSQAHLIGCDLHSIMAELQQ